MDKACNVAMDLTIDTPAGTFAGCVKIRETDPLDPGESYKMHCPGVGVVWDDGLALADLSGRP